MCCTDRRGVARKALPLSTEHPERAPPIHPRRRPAPAARLLPRLSRAPASRRRGPRVDPTETVDPRTLDAAGVLQLPAHLAGDAAALLRWPLGWANVPEVAEREERPRLEWEAVKLDCRVPVLSSTHHD